MTRLLERVHHTGLTVSDIHRSIDFYEKVLGAKLIYFGNSETQGIPLNKFQSVVGIRAAKLKYAFLKLGDTFVELICYTSPRGTEEKRNHNDIGTPHIAFRVKDVDDAYEGLSKKGVRFLSRPVVVKAKRKTWTKGWKFTYFRGPDNEFLEIFQEMN